MCNIDWGPWICTRLFPALHHAQGAAAASPQQHVHCSKLLLALRAILALGVLGNSGGSAPSPASRFVVTGILLACAVSNRVVAWA